MRSSWRRGACIGGSYHVERENLLRRNHTRRQILLVHVLPDRAKRRAIGLEAVGPKVLAEDAPGLLDVVDQERQRQMQRVGVVEAVRRDITRLAERPVKALRRPRVLAIDVVADYHGVHDRKDLRTPVVVLRDLLVVGEQPNDMRGAAQKTLRNVERKERVELARRQHALEGFSVGQEIDLD